MSKSQKDIKTQSDRFIETARQLGCDEDKERFEEKLGRITTATTAPKPKPKPQKRHSR